MSEIYSDTFIVTKISSAQFDNISRITLQSETNASIVIDINTYIYPVKENGKYSIVFKNELSSDIIDKKLHWHPSNLKNSDVSNYDYVMCGKVYHYEEKTDIHRATVYISFGGLLMRLDGEQIRLSPIHKSPNNIYYLMREIK